MNVLAIKRSGWVATWFKIDSIIENYPDYAESLKQNVNSLAAKENLQASYEWLEWFESTYKKISKYPRLRKSLEFRMKSMIDESGIQFACDWFRQFELKHLRLNTSFLTVETNDVAVVEEARVMAKKCERSINDELIAIKQRGATGAYCMKSAERICIAICEGAGVKLPKSGDVGGCEKAKIDAIYKRLICDKWWRRQFRTLQARKLEHAARVLGLVCKNKGGYCSYPTLWRRKEQKGRNRHLLEMLEAENEQGQVYTLAQLSDLGVSNPMNRRAELMTRISGFEEVAEEIEGWTPVFITQTCPSRYHSHNRSGVENPKWNHSTPRDAQKYLSSVWAKVRSAYARAEITVFGFRVAEPHHDGCPHWHSLLWFPSHQVELAMQIYEAYALQDEPPPKGKEGVRFKAAFDEVANGATSYIAKYISKNVDGLKADGEAWDANVVKTAIRTEAWAGTWGIRQFQQIGGPSVTVYREMRRLRDEYLDCEEVEKIRKSADDGNWKQYVIQMGGPVSPLKARPLRAFMVKKLDEAKEGLKNRYGEFIWSLRGVMAYEFLPVVTRVHEWVVRPVKKLEELGFEVGASPPLDLCQ